MKLNHDKYSLVIIGGGIVGLSAAIAWAKNRDTSKYPVLLIEKQPIVGGMVTSFKRKGYLFDTAQLVPDPIDLFTYLEIDCKIKKFKNYFARIFLLNNEKATEIRIPSGYDEFREMLCSRYPYQINSINKFFRYSRKMFEELAFLKLEPSFFDLLSLLFRCPKTVKNSSKTFSEYFKSFGFSDPEIFEIFDVFAAFSGLPAQRAIAMMTVAAMNTSLLGVYRPENGFIHLPQAMKIRATALGCEIITRTAVNKILVDHGIVSGVKLDTGEFITADTVIATLDTKAALFDLIGNDVLQTVDQKYARKAESVTMSPSAMTISLGLDDSIDLQSLGLDCGYNVITTGKGTFERLFKAFDNGEYLLDEKCFHTAVICPSLTTGSKPAIIIRVVPMPMANWKQLRETDYTLYTKKKEEIADFYIRQVERYLIPDLSRHIIIRDIASPATFERYSGSPTGSNYDMSPYPDNFGLKRLPTRTPVQGLFIPKFSHGIWPSMQAGLQVVDMITGGEIMNGYSRYKKKI
ncbi:MAG TPA: NAD(P)/FAD-dependent oxidoreductase [Chitinispirillaceae bacterium]|nr:NAD(P)/FAD-dependent oxidoreductase [Chitinispirillaceae bacterium]